MARPVDLSFTHLNYTAYLLTLLERILFGFFLGPALCEQPKFKRCVRCVTGEQLPCGKKLVSLPLVDDVYVGWSGTVMSHVKFRIDPSKIPKCERRKPGSVECRMEELVV